jgi:hypothetical protein
MKIHAKLEGIMRSHVGDALFALLNGVVRTASGDDFYYECELEADDPRLARLVGLLEAAGFRAWKIQAPMDHSREYDLRYRRVYEEDDFRDCRYVRLRPGDAVEPLSKAPDGRLVLAASTLRRHKRAAFLIAHDATVVPEGVRRVIEAEGFAQVGFTPTHLAERDARREPAWESVGGPWWLLTTTVVAPRRLPDRPTEQLYLDYEQRYRAADLAAVEPFDVAWANRDDVAAMISPPLIVSRRFYDLCLANRWKAKFTPVHLE